MSYQVLARKWRPRSFEDMVGQTHVVRALSNALDRGRIHHAYLFTGTRGVGKTTLARILSKALNCERGVSARPCGECGACREIDEGRFVDLLEVDAASRTKVDQTRDLLDNVPFAPVKGRFKVYLIDEVHMFSGHSFNALLKTLEEPPPHVKFLLATTDPQKVPVTVLSRCLQLNLKRLLPDEIQRQLARILTTEEIEFDDPGLALLARAADGSMRDGLSLLDQAIAFGGGQVRGDEVRLMLGTVSRDFTLNLLQALADRDGPALLDEAARIADLTPDFSGVLQDLLALLHRIALLQQVPSTLAADDPDWTRISALAAAMPAEDVQLYYQIGLLGQQDLALAPDPRTGIEMVLLRMLAFRLEAAEEGVGPPAGGNRAPRREGMVAEPRGPAAPPAGPSASAPAQPPAAARPSPAAAALAAARQATAEPASPQRARPPRGSAAASQPPVASSAASSQPPAGSSAPPAAPLPSPAAVPATQAAATAPPAAAPAEVPRDQGPALGGPEDWHRLVAGLGLGGVARELAGNCQFASWDGQALVLTLDPESRNMWVASAEERLREALAAVLGPALRLEIRVARSPQETPAQRRVRIKAERVAEAQVTMDEDPVAQALQEGLGARWVPGSIEPAD